MAKTCGLELESHLEHLEVTCLRRCLSICCCTGETGIVVHKLLIFKSPNGNSGPSVPISHMAWRQMIANRNLHVTQQPNVEDRRSLGHRPLWMRRHTRANGVPAEVPRGASKATSLHKYLRTTGRATELFKYYSQWQPPALLVIQTWQNINKMVVSFSNRREL